ncbi:MAG: response regulator [Candidatus Rokuibacteriota bacterium]
MTEVDRACEPWNNPRRGAPAVVILVIDDQPIVAGALAESLQSAGNQVIIAGGGEEGLAVLEKMRPDAVFLDLVMPGMDGLEVLRRIRELDPGLPVVILSGWVSPEAAERARKMGVADVLSKPEALKNLVDALPRREKS